MPVRFHQWMRERGWLDCDIPVVLVKREATGIHVWLERPVPPPYAPWLQELSQVLARQWQTPVVFDVPHESAEHLADKLIRLFQTSGGSFVTLLDTDAVTDIPGGLRIRFPNRVAWDLFEKWGGTARVQRALGRELHLETAIAELPPPPPTPVVAAPIAVSPEPVQSIGSGIPAGEPLRLSQLPMTGDVIVTGRVLSREVRQSQLGLKHATWTITDDTGAVRLKWSERRGGPKLPEDLWPVGRWVKVAGTRDVDKFTEERVIVVKSGGLVDPPLPEKGEPRIEFHAHTKMSAMDGLVSPKELFQQAALLGMKALAVVDHGVVQTYPELEGLEKSTGVRPVYGIEINLVDTEVVPLTGDAPDFPRIPLVVVDVETTGLSPWAHEVIELGAVRVEEGRITDTFHRLIRPTRSVSAATTRITGIKAEELAEGVRPEEAWGAFFQWAEGAVLAAHNARFDMGFLRRAYQTYIRPDGPTTFPFAILDTLALARALVPGLKSYGLGPLTDYFRIPLSQHHRALADAEATGHLTIRLLTQLMEDVPHFQSGQALAVGYQVGRPIPAVVLVKSQPGIEALYRLVSESHLQYFHRVPRIPRNRLTAVREHLLIGSPFHGGEIAEALFRNADDHEREELGRFYDYWEVVAPGSAQTLMSEENLDGLDGVRHFIEQIIEWGQKAHKPVLAVSDVHYLRSSDSIYREILAQTAKGELHNRLDTLYLRTTEELLDEFAWLGPEIGRQLVIEEPEALLARIEPVKPVPSGLFSPKLPEAEEVVSQMPYIRARELYGDPLPDIVQKRLDKEVHAIVSNGFASIYYIAHRLVQKSLDDGYLVGSRGSVGSSLVATLLRITEVNPLPPHYRCPRCRYTDFEAGESYGSGYDLPPKLCPHCQTPLIGDGQDIPFETFLGFEGDKVPDIDLNFSGDYQPVIHRYTEELFGQGHVFRAGTIATVAEKTAFGLVKAWARENGRELTPAEIEWLASGITGVKRTTGQHPGGLMVVPADEDIHHFCPVQHPADDRTSDVITTHFDYHAIEGRLLKLDLLGHDDPTVIRMLQDLTGIAPQDIPFQDDKVMSLFREVSALGISAEEIATPVGSLGIPEFGTRFVRNMLVDTRPKTFAELIRISGLSHGTEVWTNNAQDLIRQQLANLSEVIATRDDIMLYLIQRGLEPKVAFGISESVRKGKGLKPDQIEVMKAHGVPDWYIESCGKISYLFPKAHAAAYVMMGWRIAWFKVYHPLAYYATYFSVRASDFAPDIVLGGIKAVNRALADIESKGNDASPKEKSLVIVLEVAREMLARGFHFYPIDLERSHATRFLLETDGLLMPFAALPGLGQNAAQHIIEARQEKPFLSIDDLRQRARLTKSVIDLLRQHGALDGLGETSQLGFF